MHSFQDLDLKTLKKICSKYNLHVKIAKYSKLSKEELIPHMEKHLMITTEGKIKIKKEASDMVEDELSKMIEELKSKLKEVKEKVQKQKAKKPVEKKEKEEKNINIEKKEKLKKETPKKEEPKKEEPKKEESKKEAPINFYDDFDKTIRKYIKLNSSLDEQHFKDRIKEYENDLKYLQNRKLKSAKSKEENNDKISHAKIYLNSYKEKLDDIPQNKKELENLMTSFQEKYKINFKEFLNQLDEDLDSIRNKPYWSLYNSDKSQKIINKIYSNLNKEEPKKETPKEKKSKKETPKEDETPVNFDDLVKEYIKLYENKSDNVKLNKYAKAIKARSSYGFDNRGLLSQIYNFYKKKEAPKEDDEKYRQHGKEQVKNLSKKYNISEEEVMKILSMIDKDNMEKGNVQPLTEVEFEYYLNKEKPMSKNQARKKEKEELGNARKAYADSLMKEEKPMNKIDKIENELQKLEQLIKMDEKENEKEHKEMKKEIKQKKEFTVEPLTGSKAEMTKQYKKQALKFHPDKNIGHEEEAKKAFQKLTAEYEKKMGDDAKEVVDEEEDKFNSKSSFVNIVISNFIKAFDTAEKRKENFQASINHIKRFSKHSPEDKKLIVERMQMFKKDEDYMKFIGSESTRKLSKDELNKALNDWYQLKFIGNSKRDILEWAKKYNLDENKSYDEIKKTFKL